MNQQFWGSLVTALLISTATGTLNGAPARADDQGSTSDEKVGAIDAGGPIAPAEPAPEHDSVRRASVTLQSAATSAAGATAPAQALKLSSSEVLATLARPADPASTGFSSANPAAAQVAQVTEVTKIGTRQSQPTSARPAVAGSAVGQDLLARTQPHSWQGRAAATLYVRGIPIATFLAANGASDPEIGNPDPLRQATEAADRLNALQRAAFDAGDITPVWSDQQNRYQIRLGDQVLLSFGDNVRLPDATRTSADNVLSATNRLRRLLGNAPPIDREALPAAEGLNLAQRSIRLIASGLASWYGPGFHGNRSANGEVFNQNAMTAAHRHLPFGTRVRVVNRNNGRSVVVRITDRGPYAHGRVIDLSAAAARVIGLIQSGVAPVRLEVIGR